MSLFCPQSAVQQNVNCFRRLLYSSAERPTMLDVEGKPMINPVMSYGIKILSMGFFSQNDEAIVWRGPMAAKAMTQLFTDAYWGDLDYLLIDLPPGTGDIHLSLVQTVPLDGAVIVSTPQEVALADARRGVNMFKMEGMKVPVLGIVENMAWFTPAELPDNKYYIFGRDGAKNLAEGMGVPFLGAIPLALSTGAGAESRQQIGWVIVGGMTLGTLLTIFVVPTMYTLFARKTTPGPNLEADNSFIANA